jgi:hypothetical protein
VNIFEAYNRYRKDTESNQHYHLWSCLYAISTLLGRKCFLPQGHYTIFPQLYTIIVGEAAMRKTTATSIAKRLVKEVGGVPIAPSSSSREAMIDLMSKEGSVEYTIKGKKYEYKQLAAFANEFDTFVGGQHVSKSIITFLTDIWDENPYQDVTRKNGKVEIINPYFTLLGCCVPAWFENCVKGDIITGGFTRRTIFVYEEEMDHLEAWPAGATKNQQDHWGIMVNEGKRIAAMTGEFVFTEAAIALQSELYFKQMGTRRDCDEKLKSYYSSRHDLLKKVAICLSAGYSSNMVVDASIVELAHLLQRTEKHLERLFRGVGRNELGGIAEKIFDEIQKKGNSGLPRAALVKLFFSSAEMSEIEQCVASLMESGRIVAVTGETISSTLLKAVQAHAPQKESTSLFERVCRREPSDMPLDRLDFGPTSVPPGAVLTSQPCQKTGAKPGLKDGKTLLAALVTQKKP